MSLQRIIASFLSLTMVISQSAVALAQQKVVAPAIVVTPQQVKAMEQEIVNQDRINRDEEIRVRQLINEHQSLIAGASELKASAKAVNDALDQYANMVIERDRIRIATNATNVKKVGVNAYETDPVYVEAMLEQLNGKKQALEDKYKNLTSLRDQLASINERLRDGNSRQDMMLVDYAKTVDQLKAKLLEEQAGHVEQISNMQEAAAKKSAQIADLRKSNLDQQTKINELSSALEKATSQMADASKVDGDQAEQIKDLTQKLLENDAKVAAYDQIIAEKDQKIAGLTDRLKKSDATIAELKSSLAVLNDKIVANSAKHTDWEDTVTSLKALLEKQSATIKSKDSDIEALQKNIAALNAQMQVVPAVDQSTEYQEKIDRLEEQAKERLAEVEQINKELRQNKESVSAKDQLISDLKRQAEDRLAEVEDIKSKLEQYKNEAVENDQMIKSQQAKIDEFDTQLTEVEKQKSEEQSSRQQNWNLLDELRQQVASLKADFVTKDKELAQLEGMIENLQTTISQKGSVITSQEKTIADLTAQLKEALAQAQAYKAQALKVDELQAAIDGLKNNLGDQKAQQVQAQESQLKYELAKQLIDKQEEQIALLEEKTRLNVVRQEQIANQVDDLSNRLKVYIDTHQQINSEALANLNQVNAQLVIAQNQIASLKDEIKARVSENAQLSTMLDLSQDKLKATLNNAQTQDGAITAAKTRQGELENTIRNLTDQLALKEAAVKKVKEYFYELERRSADKDEEIKAKELSLAMLQQMIDQNRAKNEELVKQIEKQQQELMTLRQDLALANERLSQPVKAPEPVVVTKVETKVIEKTDEAMIAKLQAQVVDANSKVADLSSQLLVKEQALTALKNDVKDKGAKYDDVAEDINRLTSQVAKLKEELNRRITDLQYKDLEVKRLKEQTGAKEKNYLAQIASLNVTLKKLEAKAKAAVDPQDVVKMKIELAQSAKEIRALQANIGIKSDEIIKLREQINLKASPAANKAVSEKPVAIDPDLTSEVKRLKKELLEAQSQQDKGDIRRELKDSQNQVKAIKEELVQGEQRIADLETQLKKAKAVANNEAEVTSLKKQLAQALSQQDNADLKKELKDALNKIKGSAEELGQYQDKVAELQEKLKQAQDQLAKAQAIKPAIDSSAIAKYKNKVDELTDALSDSNERLAKAESLAKVNKDMQQELREAKDLLDKRDNELVSLKKKLAAKGADEEAVVQLKQVISDDKAKIEALTKEIAKLSSKPVVADEKPALLKQIKQKEQQLTSLEKELKSKTGIYLSQQQEIDQLRADLKVTKNQVKSLTFKLDEYQKMVKEFGVGNEGYLVRDGKNTALMLREVNQRIEVVQRQLAQTISERDGIKNDYEILQAQLNEARSLLQACMAKIINQPVKFVK